MRKITSLLLTAILLATMLTVFAVTASAAGNLTVNADEEKIITGDEEYGMIYVRGVLVVEKDAVLTADSLEMHTGGALLIEPGAKIKAKAIKLGKYQYVPSGATIECEETLSGSTKMRLESGATLKAKKLDRVNLTVCAGATVETTSMVASQLDLYGTMKNPEDMAFSSMRGGTVSYHDGALLDLTFEDNAAAQQFVVNLVGVDNAQGIVKGNRVYKHDKHVIEKTCVNCGEGADGGTGSTLSEGNLTIIVGVACSVVFLAVGFFIGTKKKKKPALASGAENADEE